MSTETSATIVGQSGFLGSLRGKLMMFFLGVGLLPLLAMGYISYLQASRTLRERAGAELADLAFNASDKLDRNLFERYGDVQAYAKSEQARSMDAKRLSSWMNTMMTTYSPIYTLMAVASADGRIVAVNSIDLDGQPIASESLIGLDVSSQDWFKEAMSGRLRESESHVEDLHRDGMVSQVYGAGQRGYAMSFSFPIRDAQGRIVGVWTNRFNWQVAQDILNAVLEQKRAGGAKTMELTLVNREGRTLASKNAADTLTKQLAGHALVDKALRAGATGYDEGAGLDQGAERAMMGYFHSTGYATYPGVNWAVVASQQRAEALAAATDLGRTTILIAVIGGLLIAAAAYLIARSISRPLQLVVGQLRALAAGGADLTQRLPEGSRDEVGDLARVFNAFMESLSQIVRSVVESTAKLSSGTTEIAAASNQMAAGAESQTQQVIRTSSAMEQMSASIKEVARNAHSTAAATETAASRADQGLAKVENALRGLTGTNTSLQQLLQRSAEIDHVVKLISDIAAQTNILALNAAIEAAGAGAAGARFDVVAEEIRKLAGRTAESTARISVTVAEVQREMQTAAERMAITSSEAEEIGRSFNDIVAGFTQIKGMMTQISSSTSQQAKGAEQVAEALQLITRVSQQTAQATRETSVTIDDLSGLAHHMSGTVGRFRL